MKTTRWIAGVLAAGLMAALAGAAEEASRNVVGFVRVDLAPGFNLVAYNWDAGTEDGRVSVQELFATERMTGGRTAGAADNILFWDAQAQRYVTVWLYDSGGRFPAYDGQWIKADGSGLAEQTVGRGDAFWVVNRSDQTVTQYMKGEAVQEDEIERTIPEGYSMFGRAYTTPRAVNEMEWSGAQGGRTAGTADNILFWDAEAQRYVTIWLYDSGGRFPAYDGQWIKADGSGPAENAFAAGVGAWYVRRGSGALVWSDKRLHPSGIE